jgi:biotin transport system substrate-specific component
MKSITIRGLIMSSLFAALLVVFSFAKITIGFTPVPITLQTLAVMLAGACLGPIYGFISMALVIVLTAAGLPLIGGVGGMGKLLGATGGYIWMWPFSALLIGYVLNRVKGTSLKAYLMVFLASAVFGSLLVYVSGVPWLAHVANISLSKAMVTGFYPYIAGDVIKAVITALIAVPIRVVYSPQRLSTGQESEIVKL